MAIQDKMQPIGNMQESHENNLLRSRKLCCKGYIGVRLNYLTKQLHNIGYSLQEVYRHLIKYRNITVGQLYRRCYVLQDIACPIYSFSCNVQIFLTISIYFLWVYSLSYIVVSRLVASEEFQYGTKIFRIGCIQACIIVQMFVYSYRMQPIWYIC